MAQLCGSLGGWRRLKAKRTMKAAAAVARMACWRARIKRRRLKLVMAVYGVAWRRRLAADENESGAAAERLPARASGATFGGWS